MTDLSRPPEEPMSDLVRGDLAWRGTALSLAMGFEMLTDKACAIRAPFRDDLVGDPIEGGLAGGVIFALLDQTCGMAIGHALRARAEAEGRELRPGGMATLDFRLDHIRPPRPGAGVTAEAECLNLTGDIAIVRGWAYEDDPAEPIAAAQAAFMLTNVPLMSA
ncbi:MAG TPA: PaaI family thioesterase [Caulobacteraceae bacterium]|jgi:acyl-coenzyme A thioesterase PaaI-like protein|nr:PaaI family thioesterase [Caulobacteraceae bacterium]